MQKTYNHMYISCYSLENFYIENFEMGADAYREDLESDIFEKLRIVSILSCHVDSDIEEMDVYNCEYDYDVIFTVAHTKYAIAFESDGEVDEIPVFIDVTYC